MSPAPCQQTTAAAHRETNRLLAINTGLLTLTELLTKVLSLVLIILVARTLGPAQMGIYAFALSFIQIFEIVVNFGLERYIQREVGRHSQLAGPLFPQIFSLKVFLYLLIWVAILGLSVFFFDSPLKRQVVLILSLTLFFRTNLTSTTAFFRATLQARYEALVIISLRLIYTLAGVAAVLAGYGLLTLVSLELLATATACTLAWWLSRRHIGWRWQRPVGTELWSLARAARDFFLLRLVLVVFTAIDMLMLSWLSGDVATGFYAVAARLTTALDFFPEAFGGAFLPVLSRRAREGWQAFTEVFQNYYKYLLIIGLGLAVGLSGLAAGGIATLFGTAFLPAVATLRWLALALLLDYVNRCLVNIFIAVDEEQQLLKIFGLATGAKLLFAFLLIPLYQQNGAALAAVLAEGVILAFLLFSVGLSRLAPLRLLHLAKRPLLAAALTAGAILGGSFWPLPLALQMPLAGLTYGLCLLLARALSWQEVLAVRDLLRGPRRSHAAAAS